MTEGSLCYNAATILDGELCAWVMKSYVTGRPSPPAFTEHIRHNSPCFRQIAEIWFLLSGDDVDAEHQLPAPNLSFLSPRNSDR